MIDFLFEQISYMEVSNVEGMKDLNAVMGVTFSLFLAIVAEQGAYFISIPFYIGLFSIYFFTSITSTFANSLIFPLIATFPIFFIVVHLPIGESSTS